MAYEREKRVARRAGGDFEARLHVVELATRRVLFGLE